MLKVVEVLLFGVGGNVVSEGLVLLNDGFALKARSSRFVSSPNWTKVLSDLERFGLLSDVIKKRRKQLANNRKFD